MATIYKIGFFEKYVTRFYPCYVNPVGQGSLHQAHLLITLLFLLLLKHEKAALLANKFKPSCP